MEQEFQEKQNNLKLNLQEINRYNTQYYRPVEKTSDEEKLIKFRHRLDSFKEVHSLAEAKDLLNKTMPVQMVRTAFYVGDGKCTIINRPNQLRICFRTPTEIICYDFR